MVKKPDPDRPHIWLVRQPQGLIPSNTFDAEYIARYPFGARIIATLEQPRDPLTLRRFHGMVDVAAKALGRDPESLKNELKFRAELVGGIEYFDGTTYVVGRSLKELDEAELRAFIARAEIVLTTEICPGLDLEELRVHARRHTGTGDT